MPGRHRPATTLVALAVLTLALLALTAGPFVAAARAVSVPTAPLPTAPAPTAPAPSAGPKVELRVATMTPRVVTSTGPGMLTVTGEIVNNGDAPVHDLEIRAQRGDRLRTEGDLRTALAGDASDDAVTPAFADVVDELGPGQRHPVELTVPLRGAATNSLALQREGVYELLLNVNGAPEDGDQVRLAGLRMLLPVLGLPALPGRPAEATTTTSGGPTPVTVLYPLADQPRRLPTGPGEPVLLGDDQLAASLDKGGRLDGLLGALEAGAPAGSPVRDAVCVAVDPDLLRTVAEMSGGYRVRAPDDTETDGRGARLAGQWLDRLRAVVAGRCVVVMPFADADLVALSRAGLDDLARYASSDGARIAGEILRTPVRADTLWPADGLLDERSLGDYVGDGGRAVVLSADAVAVSGRSSRGTTGGTVALPSAVTGLLADPLVTLAAEGDADGAAAGGTFSADVGTGRAGTGGRRLGALTNGTHVSPAGTGGTLSAQDAIGAVAFRALSPASAAAGSGTPLLVAPPHRWNISGTDARELLGAVGTLIAAGQLAATPLADAGAAPALGPAATGSRTDPGTARDLAPAEPDNPTASLVYPLRAGAREIPGTVTARLRSDRNLANELRAAAEPRPAVGATPAQVFDPVTEGLLRAGSAVWRGQPVLAEQATKVITDRVQLLRSLVRVLEPPSPYSLGDEEAPLPITLANGLPVEMRVRVVLSDTPGLRTEKISDVRIPPMGRLQLRVNAQLTRSGQFSVEARLTTVKGVPLGVPSRLLLRSTAYGTITLWLTGTAGVLLVILAVRRITRRLRGNGRRHPAGTPPEPGPGSTGPTTSDEPKPEATTPVPAAPTVAATVPVPAPSHATRHRPPPGRPATPNPATPNPATPNPATPNQPVAGPPVPGQQDPRRNGAGRHHPRAPLGSPINPPATAPAPQPATQPATQPSSRPTQPGSQPSGQPTQPGSQPSRPAAPRRVVPAPPAAQPRANPVNPANPAATPPMPHQPPAAPRTSRPGHSGRPPGTSPENEPPRTPPRTPRR